MLFIFCYISVGMWTCRWVVLNNGENILQTYFIWLIFFFWRFWRIAAFAESSTLLDAIDWLVCIRNDTFRNTLYQINDNFLKKKLLPPNTGHAEYNTFTVSHYLVLGEFDSVWIYFMHFLRYSPCITQINGLMWIKQNYIGHVF